MKKKLTLKSDEYLLLLASIYASVSIAMNIFCMKPLTITGNMVFFDGGQTISWIVFLLSNVIVEVWGEEKSVKVIAFASISTFLLLFIGRLLVVVPSASEYKEQADAFALIFSNGPRTILSSVIAFYLGGVVNVKIIALLKGKRKKDNALSFFSRASFSTLIGQAVDNALFMTLAFAPIGLSAYEMLYRDILSSVLIGTLFELSVEAIMVPFITIPLTRKLKEIKEREV